MKIPKKLKIGGHVYKVKFAPNSVIDNKSCGLTDRTKGIIGIDSALIQSEKEETLFHEILHCINSELDEPTVDFLGQAIYAVLKHNNMLK